MKNICLKQCLVGALVVLFATGLMMGQFGSGPHGGPGGGAMAPGGPGAGFQGGVGAGNQPDGGPLQSIRVIARFLQLSEEQVAAVKEILQAAKEDSEPIQEAIRLAEEALRAEVNSEEPSELIVGAAVLEIHDLKGQLREIHEGAVEAIAALLTEEQQNKVVAVRRAARLQPVVRAFHELGLIPPHPQGPGLEEPAE